MISIMFLSSRNSLSNSIVWEDVRVLTQFLHLFFFQGREECSNLKYMWRESQAGSVSEDSRQFMRKKRQ